MKYLEKKKNRERERWRQKKKKVRVIWMCPTKTNRQQFGGRHIQVCAPTAPPLPFFF
jgi:hypothetical protein